MAEKYRALGKVKLVQLQPTGLIIKSDKTDSGYFYDASRRVEVDEIIVNTKGIEAILPDGKQVLDIHHLDHPDKEYDDDDLICIGFTSHYDAMREKFGDHMVDGIAGENIIIEFDKEVWEDNLSKTMIIENHKTGHKMLMDFQCFAAPCSEFSHFATNSQDKKLPVAELKETLKFLNKGRRGFLLVLCKGQEPAIVSAGDLVYVV